MGGWFPPYRYVANVPLGLSSYLVSFGSLVWLTLTGYYVNAFKTGVYPNIVTDKIFLWARPHGKDDSAPDPWCGRPNNAEWTDDYVWALLFATAPGTLELSQGPSRGLFDVNAGVNKLKLPSGVTNAGVTAVLRRAGVPIFSYTAPITFTHNPPSYNFNAFVFVGP